MRRTPNEPETMRGPHRTSCSEPAPHPDRRRRAPDARIPPAGNSACVLVNRLGEQREMQPAECHVSPPPVFPLQRFGDRRPRGGIPGARRLQIGHLDREIGHADDAHQGNMLGRSMDGEVGPSWSASFDRPPAAPRTTRRPPARPRRPRVACRPLLCRPPDTNRGTSRRPGWRADHAGSRRSPRHPHARSGRSRSSSHPGPAWSVVDSSLVRLMLRAANCPRMPCRLPGWSACWKHTMLVLS